MADLNRLRQIEANAWQAYREAQRRARERPNAVTKLRAIDEGERWQRRNEDLHHAMLEAEKSSLRRKYA